MDDEPGVPSITDCIDENEDTEPDVPPIEEPLIVPMKISNDIIDEDLEFVVNDILKESKCTSCKSTSTDYHRMFDRDTMEMFELNDLYVCNLCLVSCSLCNGPNSRKLPKRYDGRCLKWELVKSDWEEKASESLEKMEPIP